MRFAVLLALPLFAASAQAQVGTDVFVQQAGIALTPSTTGLDGRASRAELLRGLIPSTLAGDANAVVLEQEGSGNSIEAVQRGTENRLLLSQIGGDLSASFVQDGIANEVSLSMEGESNTVSSVQIGDGNRYTLSLSGSETSHDLLQVGDDLQATQFVAPGVLPASIEQRGQATAVTVVRQ